jgi:hypothetical protein
MNQHRRRPVDAVYGGPATGRSGTFDIDPDLRSDRSVALKETYMRYLIVAAFAAALSLVVNVSTAEAGYGYGMHRHHGHHYGWNRGHRYGWNRGHHYGWRHHHHRYRY